MEHLKQELLSSLSDNILPITSVCNVKCIFCSHQQNPPGLESFFLPPLAWEELEDFVKFLSPEKKVVIGESTTRIMEGEPFTHPRLLDLLRLIRRSLPLTPIQITTNGTLLTLEIVQELKKLEPLEIVISLNSACPAQRKVLMGGFRATEAIRAVEYMAQEEITFHGSIVALPWLTGWEDLASTLDYLAANQARTIRIFLPGFTRYSKERSWLPRGWEQELRAFVEEYRRGCQTPLTLEPAGLTNLQPLITGVIKNSPAQRAGLRSKQEIITINGITTFSRVDAFYKITAQGKYLLKVRNEEGMLEQAEVVLREGEKSGLVLDYDLDPATIVQLRQTVSKARATQPLILASQWGEPLLGAGLRQAGLEQLALRILAVPNLTFGGTIKAAGLLLVNDFRVALTEFMAQGGTADFLVLPALAFDSRGRDLQGEHYLSLQDTLNLKVQLI